MLVKVQGVLTGDIEQLIPFTWMQQAMVYPTLLKVQEHDLAGRYYRRVRDQRSQHWQQRYYNEFKEYMIDYVGNKHNPENDDVTVDMVVETLQKFLVSTYGCRGELYQRVNKHSMMSMTEKVWTASNST